MRLSTRQIEIIRERVGAHYGTGSGIWVFGSRLDDARRGGDIDLYVEPQRAPQGNPFLARQALQRDLERHLRTAVDVVVRSDPPNAFMRTAREEGVRL